MKKYLPEEFDKFIIWQDTNEKLWFIDKPYKILTSFAFLWYNYIIECERSFIYDWNL